MAQENSNGDRPQTQAPGIMQPIPPPYDSPEMHKLDRLLMWKANGRANRLKVNEPRLVLPPMDNPPPPPSQKVPLHAVLRDQKEPRQE